jgi:hypothetical protein
VGVQVVPERFSLVQYDAAVIADLAASLLERLGMADRALRIEVDETSLLGRLSVVLGDPIVIQVESGALEDLRIGRVLSEATTVLTLGRALLRARDRLYGTFGEAPADEDLTNAQIAAWEASCLGRLERAGLHPHQQRCRYNFRNRHGFTDIADETFDGLWSAERITWAELEQRSQRAIAAKLFV